MKYKTIQLSHTQEIIQTYGVNSLMAKVIESKKIDQKQFLESYSKLRELQRNSISELITSDETLRRHTR